jgi:hypothetical protein
MNPPVVLRDLIFVFVIFSACVLRFSPFLFWAIILISQSLGEYPAMISRGLVRAKLNFICAKFRSQSISFGSDLVDLEAAPFLYAFVGLLFFVGLVAHTHGVRLQRYQSRRSSAELARLSSARPVRLEPRHPAPFLFVVRRHQVGATVRCRPRRCPCSVRAFLFGDR